MGPYSASFFDQQCHMRPTLACGAPRLRMNGVWPHTAYHHFVLFLCQGFNHFLPRNILNWSFRRFSKIIQHGQKANLIHMAKRYNTWSCGMPLHSIWCIYLIIGVQYINSLLIKTLSQSHLIWKIHVLFGQLNPSHNPTFLYFTLPL